MLGKGSNRLGAWARWGRLPLGQNQNQNRLEKRRRALRLAVEPLEDRTVLTTMLVVNSLLDDGTAGTLRAAIEQANSGADNEYIIQFDPSAATGTITLTQGELVLENNNGGVSQKAIKIEGPGASQLAVSGNNASRVFQIQSGLTASLGGLTITRGFASNDTGGGVFNDGGILTIIDSNISSNRVDFDKNGGGISNRGGTATIINSTISDNTAYLYGGGILNVDGATTIINSTVSKNTATGHFMSSAGGIYNGLNGTLTITNSTINQNTSFATGAGIYNTITAMLTITNSTVSGNFNTSYGYGGGISNSGGTATITNSLITNNTALFNGGGLHNDYEGTLTVVDSTIRDNTAMGGGGGISNSQGNVAIIRSTISGNFAGGNNFGRGGGVQNLLSGVTTITNSTISQNSTDAAGGGIFNTLGGSLTITSSTISGNSADGGGGIYNQDDSLSIINTIVAGNLSPGGSDVRGAVSSQGHNLIGDTTESSGWLTSDLTGNANAPLNPLLGPLQNNGGPTQTMALLSGSPAIDAGVIIPGLTTDQRGFPRPQGAAPDIGAYESPAYQFSIIGGGEQSVLVGQPFAQPLGVRVTDQYGNPVPGVAVTFAAPESGPSATFGGATTFVVTTDAAGLASVQALANTLAGQYVVTAASPSVTPAAPFTLTNTPDAPALINVLSGTDQIATIDTPFSQPLVVRVTDQYGNPLSGISVTFAAPESGPSATFGGATTFVITTNAEGLATAQPPLANNQAGQYVVMALASGVSSSAPFTLTNAPPVFPTVVGLERFGVHRQPTRLVLSFSEGLDPARASNLQNYVLVHAGRDGVIGTRDDRQVRLRGAVYHSANSTVSLRPAQLLSLRQRFTLTVRGTPPTGLANPAGVFLAGNGTGQPGTDYVTTFGREILSRPEVTNNSQLRENARRAPRNGQRAHPSANTPQRQIPGGPRARLLARLDQARHNSPRG